MRSRTIPRLDPPNTWWVVCFVVASRARRRGVASALLAAAVDYAAAHGAPAIEGYPIDVLGDVWLAGGDPRWDQYSPLITKYEPRMVPASLDFWVANLNREASSAGTSIPTESLNPTARFFVLSLSYITLIDRPLS